MFVHILCQHFRVPFGFIKRYRFFLLVRSVVFHNIITFLSLGEQLVLFINFLGLHILGPYHLLLTFAKQTLILFLDAHSVAFFLTAFWKGIFLIF